MTTLAELKAALREDGDEDAQASIDQVDDKVYFIGASSHNDHLFVVIMDAVEFERKVYALVKVEDDKDEDSIGNILPVAMKAAGGLVVGSLPFWWKDKPKAG